MAITGDFLVATDKYFIVRSSVILNGFGQCQHARGRIDRRS